MVEGVKIMRPIFAERVLVWLAGKELFASGGEAGLATDDAKRHFVRANAETVYHPGGTCRIGSDDGAVVDPVLRARFGRITGGRFVGYADADRRQYHCATTIIAERAADMMRACRPWSGHAHMSKESGRGCRALA